VCILVFHILKKDCKCNAIWRYRS